VWRHLSKATRGGHQHLGRRALPAMLAHDVGLLRGPVGSVEHTRHGPDHRVVKPASRERGVARAVRRAQGGTRRVARALDLVGASFESVFVNEVQQLVQRANGRVAFEPFARLLHSKCGTHIGRLLVRRVVHQVSERYGFASRSRCFAHAHGVRVKLRQHAVVKKTIHIRQHARHDVEHAYDVCAFVSRCSSTLSFAARVSGAFSRPSCCKTTGQSISEFIRSCAHSPGTSARSACRNTLLAAPRPK